MFNQEEFLQFANDYGRKIIEFLPQFVLAIIILIFGMMIVKRLISILEKAIDTSKLSNNIKPFLKSFMNIVLKAVLWLIVLAIVGVKTAGLMTLVAALGFGIAMALQGSLGNLAAGVLIMLFRPYKIGDFISIGDDKGWVKEIQILNTVITSLKNQDIIIPNGTAISENVINSSNNANVRLEFTVYMPYNESFPKVKELIKKELVNTPLILSNPEPIIGIEEFDTHSIKLSVRPFTLIQNAEKAYYNATESVKRAMGANNIQVAYSEGVEMGDIAQ